MAELFDEEPNERWLVVLPSVVGGPLPPDRGGVVPLSLCLRPGVGVLSLLPCLELFPEPPAPCELGRLCHNTGPRPEGVADSKAGLIGPRAKPFVFELRVEGDFPKVPKVPGVRLPPSRFGEDNICVSLDCAVSPSATQPKSNNVNNKAQQTTQTCCTLVFGACVLHFR